MRSHRIAQSEPCAASRIGVCILFPLYACPGRHVFIGPHLCSDQVLTVDSDKKCKCRPSLSLQVKTKKCAIITGSLFFHDRLSVNLSSELPKQSDTRQDGLRHALEDRCTRPLPSACLPTSVPRPRPCESRRHALPPRVERGSSPRADGQERYSKSDSLYLNARHTSRLQRQRACSHSH